MFKRLTVIAAVAMLIGVAAVPAQAGQRVSIGIGVGVPVVAGPVYAARAPYPVYGGPYQGYASSPYPGYVWQPARYVRTRYGYQMIPGAWVPAPVPYGPYAYAPYAYAPYPYVRGPVVAPRVGIGFSFSSRGRRR